MTVQRTRERFAQALVLVGLVLVLGFANYTILAKEKTIAEGRQVLLKLRPADPRSLIQGDYMRLAYDIQAVPEDEAAKALPLRGRIVLSLDADGVGSFARLDDGGPLALNEARLRYWLNPRAGALRFGAESFLFQEGQADRYSDAKYALLKVTADGDSVLVALANEDRKPIDRVR